MNIKYLHCNTNKNNDYYNLKKLNVLHLYNSCDPIYISKLPTTIKEFTIHGPAILIIDKQNDINIRICYRCTVINKTDRKYPLRYSNELDIIDY